MAEEAGAEGGGGGGLEEEDCRPVLEAKTVYILMSKDHRISRNRRAEWFFSRFNTVVALPKDEDIAVAVDEGVDFYVVSAIPRDPGDEWTPATRHLYRYKVTTKTVVTYLARRYRIVYCIDVSPSVAAVDIQSGTVVFDGIYQALKASLDGLMRPFYIPGSTIVFQPKIYITVITHSPFVTCINNEVILQGKLLGPASYCEILDTVIERLNYIETKMATITETLLKSLASRRRKKDKVDKEKTPSGESKNGAQTQPFKSSISSDFSLVDLLKQALIALSLLPENSSSGLVILTDGVVSVPDGRYLDIILSQLRYNTVSCSFIQLSSPFHPHLCHGVLPYVDLMKFIASATFGAFLTEAPEIVSHSVAEMNVYHLAFLAWSFQTSDDHNELLFPVPVKPGEWSIRNKCFFTIRDMPIIKKLQFETRLTVDYMKVLSCRLREGFMIKDISINDEGQYVITLTLPWKFLIHLEYIVITDKNPDSPTGCILFLEGPYDFLHDVTCLAARSFSSIYRQLMVNRFWATRKNLSESDRLLVHLNSFSSNSAYYNIPDSLRSGVPLFYFSSNSTVPQLPSEFPYPQFAQFWKPVCMLDTNVWQKWMHTHRIGVILEHDHPLPKHLHFPNSAGRFQVVLCRQGLIALNNLLKNSSSFVMVENHSYVTLMYKNEEDKTTPFSFYIVRVTSKPPHVVLRLAFLVGTPGNLRHTTVSVLREKIAALTFPQRVKEPPRWRIPSGGTHSSDPTTGKASWSDMRCCLLMNKPIEKILIRYERVPENFREVLMPQHTYEPVLEEKNLKSPQQSTFGFKPTHPTPGTSPNVMRPEMFNTVARYLHHKRWIWLFPKCLLPEFSVLDASEILTIITKTRLQEGFRFAYSSSGTITMVLEVQVQNQSVVPARELDTSSDHCMIDQTYLTPCVLQFVIFPPSTSLIGSYDDDPDIPEESQDLYLIMECWAEPQCGTITECPFTILNGLEFRDVPNKVLEITQECLLTLGAFDYLKGTPKKGCSGKVYNNFQREMGSASADESSVMFLPFEFELGRILPKCSQAELLFSMFFQDMRHAFSVEAKNEFVPYHERGNELLYNSWISNLASVHDREITIDARYFESLLTMVLSREDVTKTRTESKFNTGDLPAWKCFVKSVDGIQLLITLVPKTLRDTKLLYLIIEKCKSVITANEAKSFPSLQLSLFEPEALNDSAKLRQRKVSEPNCCQKSASAGLLSHLSLEGTSSSPGRKRIRALSGGESAPVLKKAFTVDSSLHDTLVQTFFDEAGSKYVIKKQRKVETSEQSESDATPCCQSGDQFVLPESQPNSMDGSLTMPLFMYDCSLSTLRNHLIFKGTLDIVDKCLDFRIFSNAGEPMCSPVDIQDTGSVSSTSSTDCLSPDAKQQLEDFDFTSTQLQEYCKTLRLAYKTSFIRSNYQSLQHGHYLSTEDLKAAVRLCHKDIISIDITEFLKNICSHMDLEDTCTTSPHVRDFIQRKFREILIKRFNCTKVDVDLFYYKCPRVLQSQENIYSDYDLPAGVGEVEEEERKESESGRDSNPWSCSLDPFNFLDISMSTRRESESASNETLPIFMHLRSTSSYEKYSKTLHVSDLPVCIDDYDPTLRLEIKSTENVTEFGCNWSTKLELVIMTIPSDVDDGPLASRITHVQECENISSNQADALSAMVTEIEWLLNDEITSLRSTGGTLNSEMLQQVALHVQKSQGKLGCFQQCIPLKFVENSPNGHLKFVEQFSTLWLPGFAFKKLDNWWYLVSYITDKLPSLDPSSALNVQNLDKLDIMYQSVEISESSTACTTSLIEEDFNLESRLPFWILFRLETENVRVYSHCRYNEDDLGTLKQCEETRAVILQAIVRLIRIVNQDLLLQSLHDTRMCNPLLEPDTNRGSLDDSLLPGVQSTAEALKLGNEDSPSSNIGAGTFACDVVWETTFKLHSRLRSGPGKSAFSRGMQILRSTLMAFEVSNRENMFVYRNLTGHVFYLRLYRMVEGLEEPALECPSENPSPRSSISLRARVHHPSADSRDETFGGMTSEGTVLLKVHGVSEAGTEIKDQLIQTLRNKLDDAVLDVLSVTLDRNPHCKLTPEDVHFIQKPESAPDAIVRFSTGRFVKLLLPPFAFYLHQNLLQCLNIPKYTRNENEYHFQDYHHRSQERLVDEHNVYLYNQSPGETGSRCVACVAVSLIDKTGRLIKCHDWKRPWNFQFTLALPELNTFVDTQELIDDEPWSDIIVEMCVWKQGRINLDILKNNFLASIKHAGWDLATEYQILTPSFFSPEALEDQDSLDRNKDLAMGYKLSPRCGSPNTVAGFPGRTLRRRNSSAAPLGKFDNDGDDQGRERSWSYTVRRNAPVPKIALLELPTLSPALSKTSLRGSTASTETIRSSFDFIGTRKAIVEDYDLLHPNYASKFRKWCTVGVSLNVPSLRIEQIDFKPQHSMDETVEELVKIINTVAPDNSTAQFWKLNFGNRDFLAVGKKIRPEYEKMLQKVHQEVSILKQNEGKLKSLENREEAEYPGDLLQLFTSREHFKPGSQPGSCVLIGRNLSLWEACVCNKRSLDMTLNSSDAIKSLYKYFPLLSEPMNLSDDRSSLNADKTKYSIKNGLLALLGDTYEESCLQSILVPRQRFLLANVSKYAIEFIFYNWSKETSDKFMDQAKLLGGWNQRRCEVLSSILLQKTGFFYNQPFSGDREDSPVKNAFENVDVKDLVRHNYPPKSLTGGDRAGANSKSSDSRSQIGELFRNLHHTHLLHIIDDDVRTPISLHGEQVLQLISNGRNDLESSLFRYWLSRGPSASNVIGKEAIDALKQAARTIHYCMTPVFFLPRWRTAIALTRDGTRGIFKRSRVSEAELHAATKKLEKTRPRHASETSLKSIQSGSSKEKLPVPVWSMWRKLQLEKGKAEDFDIPSSRSPNKKAPDSWHSTVCSNYIHEYMQYLQTLGFIPAQGNATTKRQNAMSAEAWKLDRVRRMSDGGTLPPMEPENPPRSTAQEKPKVSPDEEENTFYLQKSVPGGIIMLEVGFVEPFCYCKIHALEVHRIQGNRFAQRATTSHNTIGFVDECDKMKILMHLHSFAYDFHLRTIQNHICAKEVIKQGYHVTKFLDDFISYYCKGPNFARNTVNIGILSLQNISTPSHILFDYILGHNKKYDMNVLRMQQLDANNKSFETVDLNQSRGYDYALVYTLSKKVAYRGSEDESHLGEFEMSLVISHDAQPAGRLHNSDPSVFRIKYYIVLTSRRELYPNLTEDLNCGKLYPVTGLSGSLTKKDLDPKRKSFDDGSSQMSLPGDGFGDFETRLGSLCEIEHPLEDDAEQNVIREEKVHYMGYFSSHEQMMQEILREHTSWAENFVRSTVEAAAIDCRRDLLWQRLQVGGKQQMKLRTDKMEKDELTLRETVGILSFWEFSELLEFVQVHPLRSVDPKLKILLSQSISFFQTLIKLLSNITRYEHRYFVSPDGKIHYLAIINPNIASSTVLIEVNLTKQTNDLSLLFKDVPSENLKELTKELDSEILDLIETAVGACCYSNWLNCL